ncbi:unnamed protein product [Symbiodinium sp. CCMP2592]|nr:unnamed protein product [Symbiodinium sp. CCMP2592]
MSNARSQDWCLVLAQKDTTHFAEDYVYQTVSRNLTDLLSHCPHADERVHLSARHILQEHALGGLGFVQELIADTLLSQMRDILSTSGEIKVTWNHMQMYLKHLEPLLRGLTRRQRQDWASLLVKVIHNLPAAPAPLGATRQKVVLHQLKLLWYADDDPNRTYADEKKQLLAFADSPNFEEVKNSLPSLFRC